MRMPRSVTFFECDWGAAIFLFAGARLAGFIARERVVYEHHSTDTARG